MKKLLLLLVVALLPMVASADDSGTCGSGLTYNFDEATHTLTISKTGEGTGEMDDYSRSYTYSPWYSYRDAIHQIIFDMGVTSIGIQGFVNCYNLNSITIPSSVTNIRSSAFYGCI